MLSDLWDFSNQFYQSNLVKNRCLDLQDVYDASIDLVMWLCWLHTNDIHLERAALVQAQNVVGGVNQRMLTGMRELRAELLAGSSFTRVQEQLIRKHILNAELAIEKILLQRLQDLTSRLPRADDGEDHLSLFDYLSELSIENSGEVAAFFVDRMALEQSADVTLVAEEY